MGRDILCVLRSDWSLRWLDVCICTDASKEGFAFAVREGCRELASEVGSSLRADSFKRNSRSIRARARAFRCIGLEAVWECSSSDEDVMLLARRESHADSPEVSVHLLDPSERRLAAYGGFVREENIIILEARSILNVVQFAELLSAGTPPDPL